MSPRTLRLLEALVHAHIQVLACATNLRQIPLTHQSEIDAIAEACGQIQEDLDAIYEAVTANEQKVENT